MKAKGFELAWVVVSDLEKSKKFFTEVLGFKVVSSNPEQGWIEVIGQEGGCAIGLAKASSFNPIPPGGNAVITISVEDLVKAMAEVKNKGTTFIGETIEIPNHVKLQLFKDEDGNHFQLVQSLE